MRGRFEQLGLVEAPHGQPYGAGALTFGKQRRPALLAEPATYAAVRAHPSNRTVNGEPDQRHHDTRIECGPGRLLATMAMADAHVERCSVGAVATGTAEASTLDHCARRFCMKMRTLLPGLLSSAPNTE